MKRSRALLVLGALAAPVLAQPFGPIGAEFRVNTYTTFDQNRPGVGGPVVVWESEANDHIFGQRFSGSSPLGAEFRVNSFTTGSHPVAAPIFFGGFVVVWKSRPSDYEGEIFARTYNLNGQPGTEFRVDTGTRGYSSGPAVSSDGTGAFVVVWQQDVSTSGYDVFGRRFDGTGNPLTAPFRVNTYTSRGQENATVARSPDGDFVVVWESDAQLGPGYLSIIGQRFSSSGAPLGPEFLVRPQAIRAAVATLAPGFVVTWNEGGTFRSDAVAARRFSGGGVALATAFRVDSATQTGSTGPTVGADISGNFLVAWEGPFGGGVFARRFSSAGAPLTDEFRVSALTSGSDRNPALTVSSGGSVFVTWESNRPSSNGDEVLARRFCGSLAGDANGDGILNVADVLYLINNLFAGGPAPTKSADVNGDQGTNVQDILYLINHLFAGGPVPVCST